jgi:hypothetical protein
LVTKFEIISGMLFQLKKLPEIINLTRFLKSFWILYIDQIIVYNAFYSKLTFYIIKDRCQMHALKVFRSTVWLATLPLYSQNATWRSSTANTVRIKPRSRIVIVFVGIYSRANSKYSVFCKSHTHHVYILCTIRQQLIPIKLRNQIIKFQEIAFLVYPNQTLIRFMYHIWDF